MNNLQTKTKSKNRKIARETRDIAEENSHTKILQHGDGEDKNRVEE